MFFGELDTVPFAIAPLYSTFLHQKDYVRCHPACLVMLHYVVSRHVVNCNMQLPRDRLWLLREFTQVGLHHRDCARASPIETTPSCVLV